MFHRIIYIVHGDPGRHYCQQCDQLFCVSCKTSHLRTKISKNQTFVCGKNINQDEKPICSEHDEPFIFHCNDCDKAVSQAELKNTEITEVPKDKSKNNIRNFFKKMTLR